MKFNQNLTILQFEPQPHASTSSMPDLPAMANSDNSDVEMSTTEAFERGLISKENMLGLQARGCSPDSPSPPPEDVPTSTPLPIRNKRRRSATSLSVSSAESLVKPISKEVTDKLCQFLDKHGPAAAVAPFSERETMVRDYLNSVYHDLMDIPENKFRAYKREHGVLIEKFINEPVYTLVYDTSEQQQQQQQQSSLQTATITPLISSIQQQQQQQQPQQPQQPQQQQAATEADQEQFSQYLPL